MGTFGEIVTFSVQHQCWSMCTERHPPANLTVRLIASHPVLSGRALLTSIAINGSNDAITRFVSDIKRSHNVYRFDRLVSIPLRQARSEAFANFMVRAEGTITNLVSEFTPFHFSVHMQEGREVWRVIFLGRKRRTSGDFTKAIDSKFEPYRIKTVELTEAFLPTLINPLTPGSVDFRIVQALMRHRYLQTPHDVGLREIAEDLGLSASTLSRRIRRIEHRVLSSVADWQNFLYSDYSGN